MGKLKISLRVIILFGLLDQSYGRCQSTQWVTKEQIARGYDCKKLTPIENPITLIEDVMSNEDDTTFTCCSTDTSKEMLDANQYETDHCFMNKCTPKSFDHLCPTRYTNGKNYTYDEIFREPCEFIVRDGSKKIGMSGLCCEKKSPEGQLAAGYGAELNEFPFIARITPWYNCGGTIYNDKFIITAAHCVVHKTTYEIVAPEDVRVSIGSNFGNTRDQSELYKYQVARVITHENYTRLPPLRDEYKNKVLWDVALLELKTPIKFGPTVKSLQMAPANFEPKDNADRVVIAGWGTTDTLEQSPHLQRTDLLIRDPNRCFAPRGGSYPQMDQHRDQLLCVGGIMDGKFSPISGEGDSGGPAICRGSDGMAVHCGVTSFGKPAEPCKDEQSEKTCTPSVYARVSYFRDWIQKHAGNQDKNTFFEASLYGKEVPKDMYDHQVHITSDGGKSCGGTLISEDTVVTAATCVADDNGAKRSGIKVHYGVKDLKEGPTQTFNGQGVTILDGFKRIGNPVDLESQGNHIIATDNNFENNLAIVKLDGKAPIDSDKLAMLPESGEVFMEGKELALPRNTDLNSKMVSNEFKILDKKICQNRMTRLAMGAEEIKGISLKVNENVLCGVEKFSGGSRCDRELGGGLICKGKNDKDVLCGVQVYRLCEMSLANAFMDMSKEADWVKSNM